MVFNSIECGYDCWRRYCVCDGLGAEQVENKTSLRVVSTLQGDDHWASVIEQLTVHESSPLLYSVFP